LYRPSMGHTHNDQVKASLLPPDYRGARQETGPSRQSLTAPQRVSKSLFSPESTPPHTGQVPIKEDGEEAVLAGQNTGSPAVNGDGILPTPVSPRLTPSSSCPPFRRSDPPSSFTSTRFDDGILPTPHFSTYLPSPSSLRRSGPFPTRSGPPLQASSTPVSRSSPSTLGAHPLSFSPLPSPKFSPSSPHPSPVLASLPIPSPPLPSLPAHLASLHSLLLHLRQVAQCSVPCTFLASLRFCVHYFIDF